MGERKPAGPTATEPPSRRSAPESSRARVPRLPELVGYAGRAGLKPAEIALLRRELNTRPALLAGLHRALRSGSLGGTELLAWARKLRARLRSGVRCGCQRVEECEVFGPENRPGRE
jgi:hypothetical protein